MPSSSTFGAPAPDANSTFDVPDSTDWLNTPLAGLMPVEAALRCHVCKDFYTSPMLTQCSHTFCSLCIRRCLNTDGKCPLCRVSNQESKLQGNWALREVVEAFIRARPALLEVARAPAAVVPVEAEQRSSGRSRSPKRKAAALDSPNSSQNKRTRTSARLARNKIAAGAAEVASQEEREEEDEAEQAPAVEPPAPPPADGLVACPICNARMKETAVDRHLDTSCPGAPPEQRPPAQSNAIDLTASPQPLPARRQTPAQPAPERIPPIAYSLLKDNALRKRMNELGLSTAGSRQMLEMRHREWVMIWNANCDSARPKKRAELMRDLDIWERTLGARAQQGSFSASSSTPQVKDKDFDGMAWGTKHDDSFKALIENARKSRLQAKQATEQTEGGSDGAPETQADNVISGAVNKPGSQAAAKADDIDQMRSSDVEQPAVALTSSHDTNGNTLNGLAETGDGHRFFTEGVIPSSSQLESSTPLPELETLS